MQISALRRAFPGFVAASVAAAVVIVLGPAGPATAATGGRIGPGTQLVTAGRACTANFVFRDAENRVYLGYAASCATRSLVPAGDACSARSLPLGTRVRLAEGSRTLGYGRLRYSSLRALHRAGVTDAATCAANDFALVRISGAARRLVRSSVPYWGGPSDLGALPATGTMVFGLARPSATARSLPRAGTVTTESATSATVSTPLASTRRARGGGFLDDQGRAVGILTSSASNGDNTVVSLSAAVAYASSHGVAGLRLVRGHQAFTGTAVL
jgi:hypothetical protein